MKKRKKENIKSQNGITLVAVVITIIILLILSGVTLNYILGKNNLLEKSKELPKIYDIATISEMLEIEKGEAFLEKKSDVSLEEYIEKIKKDKIIENENVLDPENIENGKCHIIVNEKYIFFLEKLIEDIKITYIEDPLILKLNVLVSTNSIDVTATIWNYENNSLLEITDLGADYEYSIKKEGQEYSDIIEKNSNNHLFNNLDKNTKYCIRVKAKKDGKEMELEKWITIEGDNIDTPNEDIDIETPTGWEIKPNTWTNENVEVKLPQKEDYITRYTIDGSNPTTESIEYTGTFLVSNNCTIKCIYTDGINKSEIASIYITNIDKLEPTKCEISSSNETTNGFEITVTAEDASETISYGCSGIKEYTYYYKKSTETEYTSSTQTENTKTYSGLTSGLYNVYVVVTDNAGNTKQSNELEIDIANINSPMESSTNPSTWTNGNVEVTLSTSPKYTTRYTIDGSIPTTESTEYTAPFTVSSNSVINYIYTDGINISAAATVNVTNIDKLEPNCQILSSNETTNGFKITVTAEDAAATEKYGSSGIKNYTYYYKKSTETQYTSSTQTGNTKTYSGLTSGLYNVYIVVTDNAGNTKKSNELQVNLGSIATPTVGTANPSTWTKENVTITLPTISGYTTRYTTNGSAPTKTSTQYTQAFTVSNNCTIHYIYTDGVNIGGAATMNVTNIDKLDPTTCQIASSNITTNGFKITVTAQDAAATTSYGNSGIKEYTYYYKKSTETQYTSSTQTGNTKTYSGLTSGTYNVYVVAKDNAGNTKTSNTLLVDINPPTISVTAKTDRTSSKCKIVLTGTSQDIDSGIVAYAWTKNNTTPSSWTTIGKTTDMITQVYDNNVESDTKYYFWTKDGTGNISVKDISTIGYGHVWNNNKEDDFHCCIYCDERKEKENNPDQYQVISPTSTVVDQAHGMSIQYNLRMINIVNTKIKLQILHRGEMCSETETVELVNGSPVTVHGLTFTWDMQTEILTVTGQNSNECRLDAVGIKFTLYTGGKGTDYRKLSLGEFSMCAPPVIDTNATSLANTTGTNKVIYFFNYDGNSATNDWVNALNPDDNRFWFSAGTDQIKLKIYYKGSQNLRCIISDGNWNNRREVSLQGLNTSTWESTEVILKEGEGIHFESTTKWDAGGVFSITEARY